MATPPSDPAGPNVDSELVPRVLVVGGSDPSGAAGIQADLKTLTSLGVYGCSAVTAVTVQSQHRVSEVVPIPASVVRAQMEAALLDGPCAVIKTGMLVNEDVVDVIAEQADRLGTSTALIVDPVLLSSSGRSLLSSAGRSHLIEQLLARAALVTPNVPEAQELTGLKIQDASGMSRLADHLLALGASAVLIKGGHLLHPDDGQEEVVDLLRTMDGDEVRFSRPRIFGPSFRGTGCCLASAIAAGVAEGLTLAAAVEGARDYLQRILETSSPARSFRGLLHRPPSAFGQV